MKQIFSYLAFVPIIAIAMSSCKEADNNKELVNPNESIVVATKVDTIDFKGEKVIVSNGFPIEFLEQTTAGFSQYYLSLFSNENARTSSVTITTSELANILRPILKKYPDLNTEKDISESDLERIYSDFQSINSVEQVREKSDIINEYYDALIKQEAIPLIVSYKKNKNLNNARISSLGTVFGTMHAHEESVVMSRPRYAPGYDIASGLAIATASRWGTATEGTKGDGLRHSTWNCYIIRNTCLLGATKETAVNYAFQTTTAHEKDASGNIVNYDVNAAMDLYNNLSGRTWMEARVGWGVGPARAMPTEAVIEHSFREQLGRAFKFDESNYANQLVYHLGQWNNWGGLYGSPTEAGFGEPVYFKD